MGRPSIKAGGLYHGSGQVPVQLRPRQTEFVLDILAHGHTAVMQVRADQFRPIQTDQRGHFVTTRLVVEHPA